MVSHINNNRSYLKPIERLPQDQGSNSRDSSQNQSEDQDSEPEKKQMHYSVSESKDNSNNQLSSDLTYLEYNQFILDIKPLST